MMINIVIPYHNADTQYKIWANEEASIDFRREERAARCTISFATVELETYLKRLGFEVTVSEKYQDAYNIELRLSSGVVHDAAEPVTGEEFSFQCSPNLLVIHGSGRVGILYGVYELLKVQGIYWLNPWEEVVPQATGQLQLPEEKQYKPSFPMGRGFEFEGPLKESKLLWLWMARNKLNLSTYRAGTAQFQKKLGMIFKQGGHIFEEILHPDNVMPSGKTIWEEHEEWYGLPKNGIRTKEGALFTQFCMSNDELLQYLSEKLLQKLQKEWYHADRIDVWGFDTWGSCCNCQACKELGNSSDQYLHFMSFIRAYLDKAYEEGALDRRVNIVVCAYEGTSNLKAPKNPIPKNILSSGDYVLYAPIVRCFEHGFDDETCDYNKYYNRHLTGWCDTGIPMGICEYYNVSKFEDLPFLFTKTMPGDLRHYHRMGVKSMTYMHLPMIHWGVRNLTQILYAELCWDVEVNVDKVLSLYFKNRYGSHAPDMQKAYGLIEGAGKNCSSWRAWCQHSILSNLQNWDGNKPQKDLYRDSHLGDQAVQKGREAVEAYREAIDILENAMLKEENIYIKNTCFTPGIAINPTDGRFKSKPNIYGNRIKEDLMSVVYGKDAMELLVCFVEYYEALQKDMDTEMIFSTITGLVRKMAMYYVPITYYNPETELNCFDAMIRSQLEDLFYRCKARRESVSGGL